MADESHFNDPYVTNNATAAQQRAQEQQQGQLLGMALKMLFF